ncbi:MAG: hypothetical protein WCE62_19410 [Polyangiales bacterium]
MPDTSKRAQEPQLIDSVGPGGFTTRRTYLLPDGSHAVWTSRHHRRRLATAAPGEATPLGEVLLRSLWMPWHVSWWIGVVFALGSSLFIVGSTLSLAPSLARTWSVETSGVNAIFFAGSIPFTTAAYLQLFQAAHAGSLSSRPTRHVLLLGWCPRDIGWLSSALQLAGTLLFNVNTFDAMQPDVDWLQQDLAIWVPDFAGSVLFLASGYLGFAETCHAYWAWKPGSLSWWVTGVNLLGCLAFLVSAVFAFVPLRSPSPDTATLSVAFTLIGAVGFLLGSLLMLPETAAPTTVRP